MKFPGNDETKQLFRSARSVRASSRAACRAKPKTDFIYKPEDADVSLFWLEASKKARFI